jgi:hypothetical protein
MPGRQVGWLAASIALALAFSHAPAAAGASDLVVAQAGYASAADPPPRRRHPARVTVYPLERLHRECRSWLELQHRPSGDVLYPQMNCQWSVR